MSACRCLSTIKLPANCLSPLPRLPNLVMSLPLSWKMKTVHALLSTTITCPFWSTDTPFGPRSRPEPSFAYRKLQHQWDGRQSRPSEEPPSVYQLIGVSTNLEFAFAGKDANPLIIIVCDDDVTTRVHGHTRGALQLPW